MDVCVNAGVTPPMSVSAGLLGFAILKGFTAVLQWRGYQVRPFTPQENTVVQTCAVAGAAIAFSAGFGSSIPGMTLLPPVHQAPQSASYHHRTVCWMANLHSLQISAHARNHVQSQPFLANC